VAPKGAVVVLRRSVFLFCFGFQTFSKDQHRDVSRHSVVGLQFFRLLRKLPTAQISLIAVVCTSVAVSCVASSLIPGGSEGLPAMLRCAEV